MARTLHLPKPYDSRPTPHTAMQPRITKVRSASKKEEKRKVPGAAGRDAGTQAGTQGRRPGRRDAGRQAGTQAGRQAHSVFIVRINTWLEGPVNDGYTLGKRQLNVSITGPSWGGGC
jgi:hypothetical protein